MARLIGTGVVRVGKKPETSAMPDGTKVVKFSAVIDSAGKGDEEKPVWATFVVYGAKAEPISRYVDKGHLIQIISASIRVKNFVTKEEKSVSTMEFWINEYQLLPNNRRDISADQPMKVETESKIGVQSSDDAPF